MADLVVDLPGDDRFFVSIMSGQLLGQRDCLFYVDIAVVTIASSGSVRLGIAEFIDIHDVRMLFIQPGRHGRRRQAHHDL